MMKERSEEGELGREVRLRRIGLLDPISPPYMSTSNDPHGEALFFIYLVCQNRRTKHELMTAMKFFFFL